MAALVSICFSCDAVINFLRKMLVIFKLETLNDISFVLIQKIKYLMIKKFWFFIAKNSMIAFLNNQLHCQTLGGKDNAIEK